VNNDIKGLIKSVNDGSTSAFMWEWFTTKPFVDAGECRFVSLLVVLANFAQGCLHLLTSPQIGSVPTPWPSWLIAAHPERASIIPLKEFLTTLTTFVTKFNSEESRGTRNVAFIVEKFGYPKEDIEVMSICILSMSLLC